MTVTVYTNIDHRKLNASAADFDIPPLLSYIGRDGFLRDRYVFLEELFAFDRAIFSC